MLQLRRYVKSDAETIVTWIADERTCYLWSADRYGHYPVTPQDMNRQYDGFEESREFGPITAVEDGKIVGHMIMRYPNPEDHSKIRFGFIIIDYLKRGRGYGARMLREALKLAFDSFHAEKVTLGVFRDNVPAALCYLSVGFHPPLDPDEPKERTVNIMGEEWICCELEMSRAEYAARIAEEARAATGESEPQPVETVDPKRETDGEQNDSKTE